MREITRLPAAFSLSCFSVPSCRRMNFGPRSLALPIPRTRIQEDTPCAPRLVLYLHTSSQHATKRSHARNIALSGSAKATEANGSAKTLTYVGRKSRFRSNDSVGMLRLRSLIPGRRQCWRCRGLTFAQPFLDIRLDVLGLHACERFRRHGCRWQRCRLAVPYLISSSWR